MRIEARNIAGHLQRKMRVESEAVLLQRFLQDYRARLMHDLNRIAAAKVAEAGLEGTLTFMVRIGQDAHSLVVIPSNPDLFRKLEFGEFDAEGNLRSPPHSVMQAVRVTVQLR